MRLDVGHSSGNCGLFITSRYRPIVFLYVPEWLSQTNLLHLMSIVSA